jgi:hypothetical protein
VRLYAPDGDSPAGFGRVAPTLEDAYLVLMRTGSLPGLRAPQAPSVSEAVQA